MKNTKQQSGASGTFQAKQIKKLMIKPLVRQIKSHADRNFKLGLKTLKRLKRVQDLIEIMARQMARQLDGKK